MEQDYFNGAMVDCILENMFMIKSMVKGFLNGIIISDFRPDGRKYVGYWHEGK